MDIRHLEGAQIFHIYIYNIYNTYIIYIIPEQARAAARTRQCWCLIKRIIKKDNLRFCHIQIIMSARLIILFLKFISIDYHDLEYHHITPQIVAGFCQDVHQYHHQIASA